MSKTCSRPSGRRLAQHPRRRSSPQVPGRRPLGCDPGVQGGSGWRGCAGVADATACARAWRTCCEAERERLSALGLQALLRAHAVLADPAPRPDVPMRDTVAARLLSRRRRPRRQQSTASGRARPRRKTEPARRCCSRQARRGHQHVRRRRPNSPIGAGRGACSRRRRQRRAALVLPVRAPLRAATWAFPAARALPPLSLSLSRARALLIYSSRVGHARRPRKSAKQSVLGKMRSPR